MKVFRNWKKCVLLVAFLSLICVPVAGAIEGVTDVGSWSDPTTGEIFKFVNVQVHDSVRLNQSVIYVINTSVKKDERTGKWAPKTEMIKASEASNSGIWHGFMAGGFAGIAQGAGYAVGTGLLANQYGNASGSSAGAGAIIINDNAQFQGQMQGQAQKLQPAYNKYFGSGAK